MHGIRTLLRGLWGRCPVCGRGRLFSSFYGLNATCLHCAARLHQDGSPTVGAMIINMFVSMLVGFVGGIFLVLWLPSDQVLWGLVGLIILVGLWSLLFYRLARGLWVGITVLTGANDMEDH